MIRLPEVEVVGGSPTPEEERAVREAIITLWREDQARQSRDSRKAGWLDVARREGAGESGPRGIPWARSLGFMQPGVTAARPIGPGDTR